MSSWTDLRLTSPCSALLGSSHPWDAYDALFSSVTSNSPFSDSCMIASIVFFYFSLAALPFYVFSSFLLITLMDKDEPTSPMLISYILAAMPELLFGCTCAYSSAPALVGALEGSSTTAVFIFSSLYCFMIFLMEESFLTSYDPPISISSNVSAFCSSYVICALLASSFTEFLSV